MCWERKLGEHGVNEPKIPCKFNWLARGKAPHFARLLEFFFKVVGENKAEETSGYVHRECKTIKADQRCKLTFEFFSFKFVYLGTCSVAIVEA